MRADIFHVPQLAHEEIVTGQIPFVKDAKDDPFDWLEERGSSLLLWGDTLPPI
jgi:hypothetical protein